MTANKELVEEPCTCFGRAVAVLDSAGADETDRFKCLLSFTTAGEKCRRHHGPPLRITVEVAE